MNVESRTVTCQASSQKLYDFLSDFNNFTRLIPSGQVQGWQATGDTCTFTVAGFMTITLTFAERTPYSRIVIAPAASSNSPVPLTATVNLTDNGNDSTRCNMVFDSEGGNPMMTMMLKPKLRELGDTLMDQLQYFSTGL